MLPEKLILLKQNLTEYASLIEDMIEKSVKGLLQKESDLLIEVIKDEEPKANDKEIELDEVCVNLVAQYQPEARDLRTILMILKMNNDLERMGDLAVNICESGLYLIERPEVKPFIDLPRMSKETIKMLKDSINAFVNDDTELAKNVCKRDDIIDGLRNQILRELITYMTSDATTIERSLHLIRVSHNLERIADLSTNISEDVIFMVKGKVIKHHKEGER